MNRLSAKNICVHAGNKLICDAFSITLSAGQMWGVLGPNGSGKTTLLHSLAGLHPLTSGNIFLNEDKLIHLPVRTIAKQLAILFQESPTPFAQTVWDYCLGARFPHLAYFQKETASDKHIIANALDTVHLSNLKNQLITKLSGGEKRRLAIAATLAQTPQIYVLDEPTNHLDVRYQMQVLNYFRRLSSQEHATIILSLHDVNLAQQFCDHVLLLFGDGKIMQGKTADLLTAENLTALYQHPMSCIQQDETIFWLAETAGY